MKHSNQSSEAFRPQSLHPDRPDAFNMEATYQLLADEGPWAAVAGLVDDRWLVSVDPGVARARVAARHFAAGIEPDMESAYARADYNDVRNGEYVTTQGQGRYDLLIESVEEHEASG